MDESTLFKSAQKLDPGALITIFDTFAPRVYRYAFHLYLDPARADSIVGDVFPQFLKDLANGDTPSFNLSVHIFQITYQKVVDKGSADPSVNGPDWQPSTWYRDVTRGIQPAEHARQLAELLRALSTELNAIQRHILLLRYLEDFSVSETALIVGKSVGNVKVIQSRALAKLNRKIYVELNNSEPGQAFGVDP